MKCWQYKMRFFKGRLQERVEIRHKDERGEDCCIEYEWKDVPTITEEFKEGYEQEE